MLHNFWVFKLINFSSPPWRLMLNIQGLLSEVIKSLILRQLVVPATNDTESNILAYIFNIVHIFREFTPATYLYILRLLITSGCRQRFISLPLTISLIFLRRMDNEYLLWSRLQIWKWFLDWSLTVWGLGLSPHCTVHFQHRFREHLFIG